MNRKFSNFSEYGLKGDFTSFNLPNAFSTSFTPYIQSGKNKFENLLVGFKKLNQEVKNGA